MGNTAGDILAPIQEAVQPLVLATGPIQNAFNTPALTLIQDVSYIFFIFLLPIKAKFCLDINF